jgi:hypothetical protein
MSTRKTNQRERTRKRISKADTSETCAHSKAHVVIYLPIIKCKCSKPRIPHDVWIVSQYRDYPNG